MDWYRYKRLCQILGSLIDRLAGGIQWTGAFEKNNGKWSDLKMSEQPLALTVGQLNGRAVPVLRYLAQLVPPQNDSSRVICYLEV